MLSQKEILIKAQKIATDAHQNQKRWSGGSYNDYIIHPESVAKITIERWPQLKWQPILQHLAWLHDVVVDTKYTYQTLKDDGLPDWLTIMLRRLTKNQNETYLEYILKANGNQFTRKVKLADLQHNISDLKNNKVKEKYLLAEYILMKTEKKEISNKK